jgi:restriction system protein
VAARRGGCSPICHEQAVVVGWSSFSREAEDYVQRIERKIVLIDGRRLAQLMLEYDVGVATARAYVVKKVDLDYFDEASG